MSIDAYPTVQPAPGTPGTGHLFWCQHGQCTNIGSTVFHRHTVGQVAGTVVTVERHDVRNPNGSTRPGVAQVHVTGPGNGMSYTEVDSLRDLLAAAAAFADALGGVR